MAPDGNNHRVEPKAAYNYVAALGSDGCSATCNEPFRRVLQRKWTDEALSGREADRSREGSSGCRERTAVMLRSGNCDSGRNAREQHAPANLGGGAYDIKSFTFGL